ncbi:sodium:proton antiporter [Labilibaculum filiforme]|uniref:Sodium:proton antiporter n=1 Tax=Labilibaculum filiforme TaxID=1940526 RepID=A0A2N3I5A8_9BACT|nr:sodium:proton antiporter NhaD [Labilibaculum filiforme]PKQ65481.1 sodium:proton antiporter [Labilibaculum filiforme]
MFTLMVVVFVLGYAAIALEHPLKIDKAATALLIGVITWVLYVFGGVDILSSGVSRAWNEYIAINPGSDSHEGMLDFITHHEVLHHLSEISTILFFLLGAMTIVEIVDQHQGFKIITDKIKTTNKIKLLWVLSILTFFMSAALDNLTTTIVIVALIRKLIGDKKDRWFFASMVVLAANAGGAWSPIGDVTTIMLWIGGQVTTMKIITGVFLPSLFTMLVPLAIVSTYMKGNVTRPKTNSNDKEYTTQKERFTILCLGVSALLFVPVFKTVTHLPPYLGMLFGLGVMWIVTEIMHKNKESEYKTRLNVTGVLRKVDVPTVLFFLGILTAVSSLQSAGHLDILAQWLNDNVHDIYVINLIIGVLSSVVDNVPLVAAAMGMYPIEAAGAVGYASHFVQDGLFWEFLAYCAGTGGSILIIGSAAGVAAMGMEKIDFIWYFKKISLLALTGYLAGAGVYYLEAVLFH